MIIFIVYGYETLQWNKIYITSIKIHDSNIELKYLNYDKVVELNLPLSEVNFKIKHTWYKVKPPHVYLQISDNKSTNINQYTSGYWDKSKFIQLIEMAEENWKM